MRKQNKKNGFRPGPTQTGLYNHGSGFKRKKKCTIRVSKTKALIIFAVAAKLMCIFVFAYADCWLSHEATHMLAAALPRQFGKF